MNTLLNIDEQIPDEFYIFVNASNPITLHNLKFTKGFSSGAFSQLQMNNFIEKYLSGTIDYLPFIPNPNTDVLMASMFYNNITSEYRTEYNCELYRQNTFPTYPSRLSACYAFGDIETCKQVSAKYHWDYRTVKKFKLVPNNFNKVVKVNMEIISLERYANRMSMLEPETHNLIWQNYWTGSGEISMELPTVNGRQIFNSEVIWEYLIEGRLNLIEE